jgi:hypothetical protein
MRPRSWDELEVDAKLRYQMGLEANTGVGRGFADACAALMRIIPLLRQHFASEDVDPLISWNLGFSYRRTESHNLYLSRTLWSALRSFGTRLGKFNYS